jgi:phospholipase/lecithinase/hemolysin
MSHRGLPSGAIAVAVAFLLNGCLPRLHDPAPDASTEQAGSWQIHCDTARSHEPDPDAPPGVHHRKWIWAVQPDGAPVQLTGHLQDGFFVVTGSTFTEDTVSLVGMRNMCLQTLKGSTGLELAQIRAARSNEGIDAPLAFPEMSADQVSRLVVFGDSLSDNGRLKRRLKVFPGAPYWIGRFSNGPIWTDYLEADETLSVQNHSYGGASVTLHGHKPGEQVLATIKQGGQFFVTGSTGQQIDDYINRNLIDGRVQQPETTAFVIWGGANDYIWKEPFTGAISTFLNSPEGSAGYRSVVDEVIAGLDAQIRTLYAAGARRFILINLPDIGSTPIVLQNSTYLTPTPPSSESLRRLELSQRLTALTEYHNEGLNELIQILEHELPGTRILLNNTFAAVKNLMSNEAANYGYMQQYQLIQHENNQVLLPERCYNGGYLGTSDARLVCDGMEGRVFWDVVHPTTLTHCWQAYFVRQTLAQAGWASPPESIPNHRKWCQRVAHRETGHDQLEWVMK